MARMLTKAHRDRSGRECERGCCTLPGRFGHGGRKLSRFRKLARAGDKRSWKKVEAA